MTTRTRRNAEERIAELRAEIERIKAREAEQKVKKGPALRHISAAARAIDQGASARTHAVITCAAPND